jgi:hypothetical protein
MRFAARALGGRLACQLLTDGARRLPSTSFLMRSQGGVFVSPCEEPCVEDAAYDNP